MSGEGIVSVRLPPTLREAFQAMAHSQGLTVHDASRRLVVALYTLSQDDLKKLKEPPWEPGSQRISLYIGWRCIGALWAATRNSTLTNSTIFRRLFYGLFVSQEIEFVQRSEPGKPLFAYRKANAKTLSNEVTNRPSCA